MSSPGFASSPASVPSARHGASLLDAAEVHHAETPALGTQNVHRSMGRTNDGHASCALAEPLVAWDVHRHRTALANGLVSFPAEV